jgi:hypothetical protein
MLRINLFRIRRPFSVNFFKLIRDVNVTGDKNANIKKKTALIVRIEDKKNSDTKTEILIFTVNHEINSTISFIFENPNLENAPTSFINKKTIMKKDPRNQIRLNGRKTAGK